MYKIIAIRAGVSSYTINITNLFFFVQPLAKKRMIKSRGLFQLKSRLSNILMIFRLGVLRYFAV